MRVKLLFVDAFVTPPCFRRVGDLVSVRPVGLQMKRTCIAVLVCAFAQIAASQSTDLSGVEARLKKAKAEQTLDKQGKEAARKRESDRRAASEAERRRLDQAKAQQAAEVRSQAEAEEAEQQAAKERDQCLIQCKRDYRDCLKENNSDSCGSPIIAGLSGQYSADAFRKCLNDSRSAMEECTTTSKDCREDCAL